MRPDNLHTRIFLDGGDPDESKEIKKLLGFLDGQTTNPSLVSKNPEAQKRIEEGNLFTREELLGFYKEIVQEISPLTPDGSVSIEVYADQNTPAEDMLAQARDMFTWIPNAHIKFPTTRGGLAAAETAIAEGIRVNMTLIFSLAQAAAVYAATRGAKKGDVFVSPFIGRLDDKGENGMDLIKNILTMYESGDGHAEVLTASVRSFEHFEAALALGSDIITSPGKVLREWAESGLKVPTSYRYERPELTSIGYQEYDLEAPWSSFNIKHALTDVGIEKFIADWNSLLIDNPQ